MPLRLQADDVSRERVYESLRNEKNKRLAPDPESSADKTLKNPGLLLKGKD